MTILGSFQVSFCDIHQKFVSVAIVFENGTDTGGNKKYVAFIVPRMKLKSKVMLESMNSNIARVNLAGTASDWKVGNTTTPFYMDTEYTLPQ